MIKNNFIKRIITSIGLSLVLFLMFKSYSMMLLFTIIISVLSWYEFYKLFLKILKKKEKNIENVFFNSLSFAYLFLFIIMIFYFGESFKIYILYSILVSISSDIGGYIVGKTFKGKKLTKISPNKTVSGSIGSFLFSFSLIPLFLNKFNYLDIYSFILITFIISLTSQLGDLMISYLKRIAGIKDTGYFLPGHGGIVDRIDGILFAVPVGLSLLIFIN